MEELTNKNMIIDVVKDGFYTVKILMPDLSRNFLHGKHFLTVNDALAERDILNGVTFYSNDISISEDGGYYRILLTVKDCNDEPHIFHSRKLNLIDVVYEREQLLEWK